MSFEFDVLLRRQSSQKGRLWPRLALRCVERDGVTIGIAGHEEPATGHRSGGAQHLPSALDDQVVEGVRIVAGNPQRHAGSQGAAFGQWPQRFPQRQGNRPGGEDGSAGRIPFCCIEDRLDTDNDALGPSATAFTAMLSSAR